MLLYVFYVLYEWFNEITIKNPNQPTSISWTVIWGIQKYNFTTPEVHFWTSLFRQQQKSAQGKGMGGCMGGGMGMGMGGMGGMGGCMGGGMGKGGMGMGGMGGMGKGMGCKGGMGKGDSWMQETRWILCGYGRYTCKSHECDVNAKMISQHLEDHPS